MLRHLRSLALAVSLLALPTLTLSSAAGHATWANLDLTAYTHLGTIRLKASTKGTRKLMKLADVRIELEGERLPWPKDVEFRVPMPRLSELEIVHTASYSCIDDDCPDISRWPVWISLPFGDYVDRELEKDDADRDDDVCHYSELHIDFTIDGIEKIEIWDCNAATGEFDTRRLYPPAGLESARQ